MCKSRNVGAARHGQQYRLGIAQHSQCTHGLAKRLIQTRNGSRIARITKPAFKRHFNDAQAATSFAVDQRLVLRCLLLQRLLTEQLCRRHRAKRLRRIETHLNPRRHVLRTLCEFSPWRMIVGKHRLHQQQCARNFQRRNIIQLCAGLRELPGSISQLHHQCVQCRFAQCLASARQRTRTLLKFNQAARTRCAATPQNLQSISVLTCCRHSLAAESAGRWRFVYIEYALQSIDTPHLTEYPTEQRRIGLWLRPRCQ